MRRKLDQYFTVKPQKQISLNSVKRGDRDCPDEAKLIRILTSFASSEERLERLSINLAF